MAEISNPLAKQLPPMKKQEDDKSTKLLFTLSLAKEAGQLIKLMREDDNLVHDYKRGIEIVTNADLACDKLLCERIEQNFPGHHILSEERQPSFDLGTDDIEHLWVIDPIDGTVNYSLGHPNAVVSIAYYHRCRAQLGVVYNPFTDECFHAQQKLGAYLNDKPITVRPIEDLSRAIIATGFPYHKNNVPQLVRQLEAVLNNAADIRRIGAAAVDICLVACGRLHGYYETVSPWDMAAAQLIAREAGAIVTHYGSVDERLPEELRSEHLLVAVPGIADELRQVLLSA